MSDIPATITFDNLAAVALKELKAPLLLKMAELEKRLKDTQEQSRKYEDEYIKEAGKTLLKKNKKLLDDFKKVGYIEDIEHEFYQTKVNVKFYKAQGEANLVLNFSEAARKRISSYKQFLTTEKTLEELRASLSDLKKQLTELEHSVSKVKDNLMEQFLASNPGHDGFKNFIKQRIAETVK